MRVLAETAESMASTSVLMPRLVSLSGTITGLALLGGGPKPRYPRAAGSPAGKNKENPQEHQVWVRGQSVNKGRGARAAQKKGRLLKGRPRHKSKAELAFVDFTPAQP